MSDESIIPENRDHIQTYREIILTLWRRGLQFYRTEKIDKEIAQCYSELRNLIVDNESKIKETVSSHTELIYFGNFPLPIIGNSKHIILFSGLLDFTKPNLLKLQFIFYSVHEGKKRAIALRYEPGEGTHDYYHVQLCTDISYLIDDEENIYQEVRNKLNDIPDWLPDSIPCIPINAKCATTILLSSLKSIFSNDQLNEYVSEDTRNRIKKYRTYCECYPGVFI